MERAICVFAGASSAVDPIFFAAAQDLGAAIARRGYALVYGGTHVGLMGTIARAVHAHGGRVIGVIPDRLFQAGVAYAPADELIVTRDMRERKAVMADRAQAFVAFPGGFGTLEELFEVLTLKQLGYHHRPVVLLNVAGFYDPLAELFAYLYDRGFAPPEHRQLYHVAENVTDLFAYLDTYQPPPPLPPRWRG